MFVQPKSINQKTKKKTIRTKSKPTETLVSSSMRKIPLYLVEIKDINNEFCFKTEISKLKISMLLELANPNYRENAKIIINICEI